LILGVPLALPLAVLVFFGGLFPIVGAVVTGALAVLVALADQGLTVALIVAGLVLAVQQLESNVLEPVILGRAIHLHPIVVLTSITAGATLIGILGAFLAVPVAAVISEIVDELRSGGDDGGAEDGDADDGGAEDAGEDDGGAEDGGAEDGSAEGPGAKHAGSASDEGGREARARDGSSAVGS
jgi:putative heme transporter